MKIKYELNLRLYEVGATLDNVARWNGLVHLRDYIKKYKDVLTQDEYEIFKYGIDLMTDGRSPEELDFFINEAYEKIRLINLSKYEMLKDLRLIIQFIKWIHRGNHQYHTILLNSLSDIELRAQYKNWVGFNEYDNEITFEQSKTITTEDWLRIRESNVLVKNYYESLFDANK